MNLKKTKSKKEINISLQAIERTEIYIKETLHINNTNVQG